MTNNTIAVKVAGSVNLQEAGYEIAKAGKKTAIVVVGKPDLAEIVSGYEAAVITTQLPENPVSGTVYFMPQIPNGTPTITIANDVDINNSDSPVIPEWTIKPAGNGYVCKPGSLETAIGMITGELK